MNNSYKHLLVICSPNPSILIHSESLLTYLYDNNFKISLFFPKVTCIESMISYIGTIKDSDMQIKYLVSSNPLIPVRHKEFTTLESFKAFVRSPKYSRKLRAHKLVEKITRRLLGKKIIGYVADLMYHLTLKNLLSKISLRNYLPEDFCILCDLVEESKLYMKPYTWMFSKQKILSIGHGYDINTTHIYQSSKGRMRSNIYVLAYTGKNKAYYSNKFGVTKSNIIITGIINHKRLYLDNEKKTEKKATNISNKYVSLLLRPRDNINYCIPSSYDKYLLLIGNWIRSNETYHLLVKAHPKQTNVHINSVLKSMGLSLSFSRVTMSTESAEVLAVKSQFGISFYSGTCVDFAFHSKPVLELTDPIGTCFGDITQAFDPLGSPITGYSNNHLCITVLSPVQFEAKIKDILANYSFWSSRVNLAYNDTFPDIPNALPIIRSILS